MPLAYHFVEASYAQRVADKPLVRVASPFGEEKALRCANKIHALRKPDRTEVCPYVSVAFFFQIGINSI